MRRLIAFLARCWRAARYMHLLNYSRRLAWEMARR